MLPGRLADQTYVSSASNAPPILSARSIAAGRRRFCKSAETVLNGPKADVWRRVMADTNHDARALIANQQAAEALGACGNRRHAWRRPAFMCGSQVGAAC